MSLKETTLEKCHLWFWLENSFLLASLSCQTLLLLHEPENWQNGWMSQILRVQSKIWQCSINSYRNGKSCYEKGSNLKNVLLSNILQDWGEFESSQKPFKRLLSHPEMEAIIHSKVFLLDLLSWNSDNYFPGAILSCCLEMPPPKAELNPIRLGFLFYLFILFSLTAATVDLTQ